MSLFENHCLRGQVPKDSRRGPCRDLDHLCTCFSCYHPFGGRSPLGSFDESYGLSSQKQLPPLIPRWTPGAYPWCEWQEHSSQEDRPGEKWSHVGTGAESVERGVQGQVDEEGGICPLWISDTCLIGRCATMLSLRHRGCPDSALWV